MEEIRTQKFQDQLQEGEALYARLEIQLRNVSRSAGARLIRERLVQQMHGKVGLRLYLWRWAMQEKAKAMQAEATKRVQQGGAAKILTQSFMAQIHGDTWTRFREWASNMKVSSHSEEIGALAGAHERLSTLAALREEMRHTSLLSDMDIVTRDRNDALGLYHQLRKSAGGRWLMATVVRLMDGEVGARLFSWHEAIQNEKDAANTGLQAQREQELRDRDKWRALKQLRRVVGRWSQDKLVECLICWRENLQEEKNVRQIALIQEAMFDQSKHASLERLRLILGQLSATHLSRAVTTWYAKITRVEIWDEQEKNLEQLKFMNKQLQMRVEQARREAKMARLAEIDARDLAQQINMELAALRQKYNELSGSRFPGGGVRNAKGS